MSDYLAIEISEDQLLFSIAQEAALADHDLDSIEAEVRSIDAPGEIAALGLTLGRAGRPSSETVLSDVLTRLASLADGRFAAAIALSKALLSQRPAVERADAGYRWTYNDRVLFLEDPLAAHWHAQKRWGPPIRPDMERPSFLFQGGTKSQATEAALNGQIVIVTFDPGRFGRPKPPLRLTRAGFSRDPSLRPMIRWSQVKSVGLKGDQIGYEAKGAPVDVLPARPGIPTTDLLGLMERLLKQARS